jgi:hypothetical protein
VKIQIQGKYLRKYRGKERKKRKEDAEENRKIVKKKTARTRRNWNKGDTQTCKMIK